jgi:hypothetical protein
MSNWINWYCQLFGYASCSAASLLETLVLFSISVAAVPFAFMFAAMAIYGIVWAIGEILFRLIVLVWIIFHPLEWWSRRKQL